MHDQISSVLGKIRAPEILKNLAAILQFRFGCRLGCIELGSILSLWNDEPQRLSLTGVVEISLQPFPDPLHTDANNRIEFGIKGVLRGAKPRLRSRIL